MRENEIAFIRGAGFFGRTSCDSFLMKQTLITLYVILMLLTAIARSFILTSKIRISLLNSLGLTVLI